MSGWTCSSCGGSSPEGTRFCGQCGAAAAAPAAGWSCRSCGTANPASNAFCGGCGAQAQALRTEELRLVTALFADISGFTTLADTLDTESLHEVITPLVAGLTRIAERYGGFIEKFAGDALLVVYGAPVTHEDDAQRALLTALDMHAELPPLLAGIGPHAAHLTIHIGVNTGRVIGRQAGSAQQSDYAVLGDSVILAQRLESVCPPGETYVGPTTYELCKQDFDFESVGELTLKGKLKPVEGFRLLGRRRAQQEPSRPLVGRQDELAVLDGALATAARGAGVAVVVSGEPGTGKSRLVGEARTHALAGGMRWLPARCLSYGAPLPYWPFADLVRQVVGISPQDSADLVLSRLAAHLPAETASGVMRLLGLLDARTDPQLARRQVHDAVVGWLTTLAQEAPVALCVEDVHWADHATRELLGELVRTTRGSALAVVVTTRPEALVDITAMVTDVDVRAVQLGSLGTELVPELAGAVLGATAGEGLVALLAARTGGNPLFVEELSRSLKESGALVETAAGWDVRPGWDVAAVPDTVERVFATRLDALPVSAAGLLQLTSVVGRTVRLSLLDAVAGSESGWPQHLDVLVAAGLLDRVADGGEHAVAFHHALLHDVVYGRLLRKRRRELHRRVADVARSLYGDTDETVGLLARHLYLAEAGAEAVGALLRAGRRAAALYANDEAALHLERAIEVLRGLPGADAELAAALLELAEIQEMRGAYDEAYRLYDQARASTDDARAWRGVAAVLRKRGHYQEALRVLQESGRDDPALALERGYALDLIGSADQARDVLLRAADQVSEDAVLRGRLLLQLASVEEGVRRFDAARAAVGEAIVLFGDSSAARDAASAYRVAGGIELRDGRLPQAADLLAQALDLAERTGLVEEAAGILLNLGFLDMERGAASEAVESTRRAVEMFERLGHGSGRAVGYGNLADYEARRGRLADAEAWAARALEHAQRTGHVGTLADACRTMARVRCMQRRWDDAQTWAQQAAEHFRRLGSVADAEEAVALVAAARRDEDDRAGR